MFALDPGALVDAASRIASAAEVVTGLDVAGRFGGAADSLPGAETGSACLWSATRLEAAVDVWAEHLVDLCETARLVARDAAAVDQEVAGQLRGGNAP